MLQEYEESLHSIPNLQDIRQMYLTWSRDTPMEVSKAAPYLLYPGDQTVKKTLQNTTQLGTLSIRVPLRQHHKSRNPLLNCTRLMEEYATDTWFWQVRTYKSYKCNQLFYGTKSKTFFSYGMHSEANRFDALLDFFRQEGVPMSIQSDNSKMQTSYMWKQYLRRYNVKEKYIEPYNPQQNPAERAIGELQEAIRKLFIDSGCHPRAWYQATQHIIDIKNNTAYASLEWRTPNEMSTGNTPDISGLLFFKFWEKVYYYDPPTATEKLGRWCGRAINYGDSLCYWILTENTNKLIV